MSALVDRRGGRQQGFTFIEMMVAMTVSLLVVFAALGLFDAFNRGVVSNNRLSGAEDTTRRSVASIVTTVRNGGAPTPASGAQPTTVIRSQPNDLVFISTAWPGDSDAGPISGTHVERYCLDTARRLWFDGFKAGTTGNSAPGTACPSTSQGWTHSVAVQNVVNSFSNPIFRYAATSPVRSVSLSLRVEGGGTVTSRPLQLASGGTLRGALAPQVTAADVTVSACEGGKALLTLNVGTGGVGTEGARLTAGSAIAAGAGVLVAATGTPTNILLTVTNALGLQTLLTKSVSC